MDDKERHHCDKLEAQVAVLEAVLQEREKAIEKALQAADRAIDKAETTVTSRLEGFPQVYMTRIEAKALEAVVSELREKSLDKDYYYREHGSLKESLEKDNDSLGERLGRMESLGARVAGGLVVVAVIGVANLIKIWTG